ncbi:MAG: bacteriohemerythrin [Gammaproteobacteria bacterium]
MTIDIQWRKQFVVGHAGVDRGHEILLELIRNASLAFENEEPKAWCLRLLREVRKYADFHFFSEENLMLRFGFPGYLEHQRAHTELLSALDERINAYSSDQINLEAVVVFLFDWFVIHTTKEDKKFGKYLDGLTKIDSAPAENEA